MPLQNKAPPGWSVRLALVLRTDRKLLIRPLILVTWCVALWRGHALRAFCAPPSRQSPRSCVVAGILAVWFTASSSAAAEKTKALALLDTASLAFTSVLATALYPALTISNYISHAPGGALHSNAKAFFERSAADLLAVSPAIDDIQLAPYGRAVDLLPLITERRNMTAILALGGHDLFNSSSPVANRRAAALLALKSQQFILEGPKALLIPGLLGPIPGLCTSNCLVNPSLGFLTRLAIFANESSVADTWADTTWSGVLPGQVIPAVTGVTNCTEPEAVNPATGLSYCAPNATGDGRKFWGFVTVVVIWEELLRTSKITDLGGLNGSPYSWSVCRSTESSLGVPPFAWVLVSSNRGVLPTQDDGNTIVANVGLFASQWVFSVQKAGGWRPTWEYPLFAVVIVVSFALSLVYLLVRVLSQPACGPATHPFASPPPLSSCWWSTAST